jgi:hypothetical protein
MQFAYEFHAVFLNSILEVGKMKVLIFGGRVLSEET